MRNNLITSDSIRKIETGQEDDYTAGCLLDYNYFKNYYKMIAIDLRKKQTSDADPKAIQQINCPGNLARAEVQQYFSLLKLSKRNCFRFFTWNCKSILILCFNINDSIQQFKLKIV